MKTSQLASSKEPDHRKHCTLCSTPRDVLVRCQIDESGTWHFVCPGSCWKNVSGGQVDGNADHPMYRYGGMWKNKHEAVSAKKPKAKPKAIAERNAERNDAAAEFEDPSEGIENDQDASGVESDDTPRPWSGDGSQYTTNDRVNFEGRTWICRKTHKSEAGKPPNKAQTLWKGKALLVNAQ